MLRIIDRQSTCSQSCSFKVKPVNVRSLRKTRYAFYLERRSVSACWCCIQAPPRAHKCRTEPLLCKEWGASLTLGSTFRGVVCLMKDLITAVRPREFGVIISIWFFCTVWRKDRMLGLIAYVFKEKIRSSKRLQLDPFIIWLCSYIFIS